MLVHRLSIDLTVVLALVLLILLPSSASGQTSIPRSANSDPKTVVVQGPRSGNREDKVTATEASKSSDLESEVSAVKAENAAFREALRKMEEQQKALLEMVERLEKKFDDTAKSNVQVTPQHMSPNSSTPVSTTSNIPIARPEHAGCAVTVI